MSPEEQNNLPHISVVSQYIKDLSFENPNAPFIMENKEDKPKIDLSLDVDINQQQEENFFEVRIMINAKASINDKVMFIIDLDYAGIFNLMNFPKDKIEPILAVHCPSVLFPFARKIIADTTQGGSFQPLMIDPIDFSILYNKKLAEKNNS
ncbi:MAG TPA: protein-export chaperone SecB [Candidatus Megaira endosymbiont of Hartmannula sinica]|nr:protein-export chaperone SecB [Candidatus Megaera endosymbiont of Hartmannula sinica]